MEGPGSSSVTALLDAWSQGDVSALDKLTPLVYNELRRIAHRYISAEPHSQSLQTTALINEAYVRLVDARAPHFQDRRISSVCAPVLCARF